MKCRLISLLAPVLFGLTGCVHAPANGPLQKSDPASGYRFNNLSAGLNSNEVLVTLAFSGGGTRAAALSYGVLEELARAEIVVNGNRKRLLDEVDSISAVSGGSFTAAYYALHGDRIFQDFNSRFLYRNVQGSLIRRVLSPYNWVRMASPWFTRSDIAAEYYDDHIFDHATFGDLLKRDRRPFLTLNATDMSRGGRFEFTQDQFDLLCSDLSSYSLARGVAASGAFPVVLAPLTLRNYSGSCDYVEPAWVAEALADQSSTRRRIKAMEARAYQDSKQHPYLHLLDGGIADNLGLRGPLDSVVAMGGAVGLLEEYKLEDVSKVVIIVVNATAKSDPGWDRRESAPGVLQVMLAMGGVPVDRYSLETLELVNQSVAEWSREIQRQRARGDRSARQEIQFYPIVVSFDDLADENERRFFERVPSSFHLPAATVDRLREVAGKLLKQSTNYQKLLRDLRDGLKDVP